MTEVLLCGDTEKQCLFDRLLRLYAGPTLGQIGSSTPASTQSRSRSLQNWHGVHLREVLATLADQASSLGFTDGQERQCPRSGAKVRGHRGGLLECPVFQEHYHSALTHVLPRLRPELFCLDGSKLALDSLQFSSRVSLIFLETYHGLTQFVLVNG